MSGHLKWILIHLGIFFFFISLFVTMNLYIHILYFYTHHFAIYSSFRVCFFQILILSFTSKHQLTFIFFAWITMSSEKQYSQTLTNSFLLSQYLFVTWQAPVSSHLILTLQVATYRNHFVHGSYWLLFLVLRVSAYESLHCTPLRPWKFCQKNVFWS